MIESIESIEELKRLSLVYPQVPQGHVKVHATPVKNNVVYTFSDGSTLKRKRIFFKATDRKHSEKAKRAEIKGSYPVVTSFPSFRHYCLFDKINKKVQLYKIPLGLFDDDILLEETEIPEMGINWMWFVSELAKSHGIEKAMIRTIKTESNNVIRFAIRELRAKNARVVEYPKYL